MKESLEALRRLQELDRQLGELQEGEEKRRRQIRVHKRNIAKSNESAEEKRQALRSQQMEVDRLELDIKSRDQTLAKHREALNKAKSNREYSSILTVMNTEKVDRAKREGRELELLSGMDAIRAEIESLASQEDVHRTRLADAERQLAEYLEQTNGRRATLERQREELADAIPPSMLATFNRVAEHHGGEAMAAVIRLHPKREDYICQGCNMKVILERINALTTRDELQCCDACGRILFLDS